jgi:SAM-dependent methyltransferase
MLAAQGYRAVGVDMAPTAVRLAAEALRRERLQAELWNADFLELARDPALRGRFSAVVEHTCFCAIRPERRSEYAATAAHLLEPGGRLVGLFYRHGKDGGPPFNTTEDDVRETFGGGWDIEHLAPAADSHERRAGKELLAVIRRMG